MVKSHNERNPYPLLPSLLIYQEKELRGDCLDNGEEGGDDVKSVWSLCPGRHTCYNGLYKGLRSREAKLIPKSRPQFGLKAETRLHEVGIASNPRSATLG